MTGRDVCAGRACQRRARARRAGLVVVLALATALPAGCGVLSPGPSSAADPAQTAADLEDLTNDARAGEGLPVLPHSDCATTAAAERAADLIGDQDLDHAPMEPVLDACGVAVAGENLSRASVPADAVVEAWLGSPGHRANILDPQFTAIGVACVPDGDATLCSQVFLGE